MRRQAHLLLSWVGWDRDYLILLSSASMRCQVACSLTHCPLHNAHHPQRPSVLPRPLQAAAWASGS